MDASSPAADLTAFAIQEIGALLFGAVFWFLWRQSKVVYFGLWSAAWALRVAAAAFAFALLRTNYAGWLAAYAVLEFAFVIVLVAAARAGFGSLVRDWRTVLQMIALLPVFVTLVWLMGWVAGFQSYHSIHAIALGVVYVYNFISLRRNRGWGANAFRFSLVLLAAAFLAHGGIFLYLYKSGDAHGWLSYLHHESYFDFALHCVMAFAAMAMWSESQIDRVRDISNELDILRREHAQQIDLDHLTGLLNSAALSRRINSGEPFRGAAVVCDMDNFKDINDSYGHLAGDEILRNVGHLLRNSIRLEDAAYRWGGDEFVILFDSQRLEVAERRMGQVEDKLRNFRVRGFGVQPISFSWGAMEVGETGMREALDEADRKMYEAKKHKRAARG